MNYTRNWTRKVKENFLPLRDRFPRPLRILEIGVWEARSAVWMLDNLSPAEYIGIDPWDSLLLDQKKFPPTVEGREKALAICMLAYENIEPYKQARFIHGQSQEVLSTQYFQPEYFGLVYIDGMHTREAVTEDARNIWPLVQVGGIVVWDDITARRKNFVEEAADAFLADKAHEELFRGGQLGVVKR